MRCFNHNDRDAIGSCKQCSKGLCSECAADLGHGLACRGAHEQDVENINTLMMRSERIQRMAPRTIYLAPAFTGFMGLVFAGYGMAAPRGPTPFLIILGIGFMVFAAVTLAVNRRAFRARDSKA